MKFLRFSAFAILAMIATGALPGRAIADPAPPQPANNAALLDLARNFANTVGRDFAAADDYMEQYEPEDIRVQKYFDALPDGEPLILQINLADALTIDRPVAAIKQGHDVMISFGDFITATDFAIKIDTDKGTADGWFVRENQPFHMDLKNHVVTANGKSFVISKGDVDVQDGDILVKGQTLSKWFGFKLVTNPAYQSMAIKSEQKWPPLEKAERADRGQNGGEFFEPPPVLPRQETNDHLATFPNTDVTIQEGWTPAAAGGGSAAVSPYKTNYTVHSAGDVAGYANTTYMSGTDQTKLDSIRSTYTKSSENADLLGPLQARTYEFGDVGGVSISGGGGSTGGLGVHATNKDPFTTSNTMTEVAGDANPGWDVELYRNDQYLGLVTAGADGRYDFKNIALFAGKNSFRIVQYGPHGEIKEDTKTIDVTPTLYNAAGGAYDVSLALQGTQTYQRTPATGQDVNTPAFAGTYEFQATPNLQLQSGLQVLQQTGKEKAWLETGAVTSLYDTILNASDTVDSNGAYTAGVAARRSLGRHGLSLSATYTGTGFESAGGSSASSSATASTPGFSSSSKLAPAVSGPSPSHTDLSASLQGPLPFFIGDRPSYNADWQYTMNYGGATDMTRRLSVNTRLADLSTSSTINDHVETAPGAPIAETTSGSTNIGGRALGFGWRGTVSYDLYPQKDIKQYGLNLSRGLAPNLSSSLGLSYVPLSKLTAGTLSLSWLTPYAVLSPTFTYDSNKNMSALVEADFGLTRDPYSGKAIMTSETVADKGGVSALVYLDNNGNNKFDAGDELLPDAVVEAVQDDNQGITNDKGVAYIYDLPAGILTDVRVDEGSSFDPTWVSGFPGVSIRPRPGHVEKIEFPIHKGGEIDGTVYLKLALGEPRTVKNIHLYLYGTDGKPAMSAATAIDGYYLFERIPPGHYYLVLDKDDARDQHIRRPPPEPVNIGYDGKVMDGHKIMVEPAGGATMADYDFAPNLNAYVTANNTIDMKALQGAQFVLNLGDYKSRLLAAIVWYKLRIQYGALLGDARPLVPVSEINPETKTGLNTLRVFLPPGVSSDEGYTRCRTLAAHGQPCTFEMLPGAGLDKQAALQ